MVATIIGYMTCDAMITLGMCLLGCFAVGMIMRFFVKQALRGLNEYYAEEGRDPYATAKYNSIKGSLYTIIGAVLTFGMLVQLMRFCVFPCGNSMTIAWIYFVPMYCLQYFFDAHLSALCNKVFGINIDETEEVEGKIKPKRIKKPKIRYKRIKVAIDSDGNETVVE